MIILTGVFKTGDTLLGVMEATEVGSVMTVKAVAKVKLAPLTVTVTEALEVSAKNPWVIQSSLVPDSPTISQSEPSENVTVHVLPSVRLCGRPVPLIVRKVPP